jgi:hypothetical protein
LRVRLGESTAVMNESLSTRQNQSMWTIGTTVYSSCAFQDDVALLVERLANLKRYLAGHKPDVDGGGLTLDIVFSVSRQFSGKVLRDVDSIWSGWERGGERQFLIDSLSRQLRHQRDIQRHRRANKRNLRIP